MVIEKLMNGINVDALGDLGTNLQSIVSSLFSGIVFLSLTAILINVLISGGLFDALKTVLSGFHLKISSGHRLKISGHSWLYRQCFT